MPPMSHDSERPRRRRDQAARRSADGSASRPGQVRPGKFFPALQAAEQKVDYDVEAIEFMEKHKFAAHAKGWGAAHTGPCVVRQRFGFCDREPLHT